MTSQSKGATTEKVLATIVQWWLDNGTAPTMQNIAQKLAMGRSTVHWHVHRLVDRGLLELYGLVPVGLRMSYEDPRVTVAREAQMEIDRKREEEWYAQTRTISNDDE